VTTDMG